jgi:hypothetical protein
VFGLHERQRFSPVGGLEQPMAAIAKQRHQQLPVDGAVIDD